MANEDDQTLDDVMIRALPAQIIATVSSPNVVPTQAIAYLAGRQIKPSFSYLDVWRLEHARAFSVAKLMEADLLDFIQQEIDKNLAEGAAYKQFAKIVEPRLQEAGWWGVKDVIDPLTGKTVTAQLGSPSRLKLIYETNMRTARAAARYQSQDRSRDVSPYWMYTIGPSRVHRPEHLARNGMILRHDDPFWKNAYPPNGYNCRCKVVTFSQRQLDREGLKLSPSPKLTPRLYTNPRTGAVEIGYEGVDPGWAFNPGELSNEQLISKMRNHAQQVLTSCAKCN